MSSSFGNDVPTDPEEFRAWLRTAPEADLVRAALDGVESDLELLDVLASVVRPPAVHRGTFAAGASSDSDPLRVLFELVAPDRVRFFVTAQTDRTGWAVVTVAWTEVERVAVVPLRGDGSDRPFGSVVLQGQGLPARISSQPYDDPPDVDEGIVTASLAAADEWTRATWVGALDQLPEAWRPIVRDARA